MRVVRFEDLRVWQEAKSLSNAISEKIRSSRLNTDRELSHQLNGAALSVVANIAEGFLRRRDKEFSQFVRIAQGSNGEVRALLYVARDRGYVDGHELDQLIEATNVIGRMLRRLDQYLRASSSLRDERPRTRLRTKD